MWTYIINLIISYISVNLIFALWSIMGLDTYCCLIFYGFTLIHLTDPLSKMVQIMCVMCNIYMNLFTHTHTYIHIYIHIHTYIYTYTYIYIYIYIYMCIWRDSSFSSLGGTARTHTYTWTEFLGRKGKNSFILNSRTITHLEQLLGYQMRKK